MIKLTLKSLLTLVFGFFALIAFRSESTLAAGCAPAPGDFPTTVTAPMDVYQCICSGIGISPNFYYPDLTYDTKPCGINPAVCDRWACSLTGGSALSCQPGMEP